MAFKLFKTASQKGSRGWLGLEVSDDGIAIAHVNKTNGDRPTLTKCEFISNDAISSVQDTLRDRIASLNLSKVPCNWVLANADYNLLLVEAPKVSDAELREAMRWRIKDLINFPVEEAVIDVFPLPKDGSRGAPMNYVVVSERSKIQNITDLSNGAKIALKNIDIGELALRNIADHVKGIDRGACVIRLRQGRGCLTLIKQQQVYLSRQFDINYNAGLLDELPEESLILEIQRSIDYYERQQGQVPPSHFIFCGENLTVDKLTDNIRRALPGQSTCMQLSEMLSVSVPAEESMLQLCVGAIGGALREEAAA